MASRLRLLTSDIEAPRSGSPRGSRAATPWPLPAQLKIEASGKSALNHPRATAVDVARVASLETTRIQENAPLMIEEDSRKTMEGSYESLQSSVAHTTEPTTRGRQLFEAHAKRFGEKGLGSWAESGGPASSSWPRPSRRRGRPPIPRRSSSPCTGRPPREIPELLLARKPAKVFDKVGWAYPRISFTQRRDGKAMLVFSGYGD